MLFFKGRESIFCMQYLYAILHYLMNHISFSHILFFQDAPDKPGEKCGNVKSVTYEIRNCLLDNNGNTYPTR